MLRLLVLLTLLVNVAVFLWIQSDPHVVQADREPQRLERQVAPDSIQVLPDLPAASGAPGAAPPASAPGAAASATSSTLAASAAASSVAMAAPAVSAVAMAAAPVVVTVKASDTGGFAHRTSEADLDCAESAPLDDAQMAALRQALTKAGVPAAALAERRQPQGGSWMVYMGRYADAQSWQEKADELKRLDIGFERVSAPTALAPGLSLGHYPSAAEAAKRLDDLGKHGVHAARVVMLTQPTFARHLQVRATDPAWRHAAGSQRFTSCSVDAPSHL
jgi:hypothetical protein